MAQRKNNITIGIFILGALGLLFFLLIFFSGGNRFSDKERVVMHFEGSVQGLQIGAPIKLKGVDIGEIVNIEVNFLADDLTIVNVVTADLILKSIRQAEQETNSDIFDVLIEKGLRAQLKYQSLLTGLLYVELDFYPETEIRLLNLQSRHREFPTKTNPTFEKIFSEMENLDFKAVSKRLSKVLESVDKLLQSGKVENALDSFSNSTQAIETTASDFSEAVKAFDAKLLKLNKDLARSSKKFNVLLDKSAEQVPILSNEFVLTLSEMRLTLDRINSTMATAGDTFSEDSVLVEKISNAAQEVSRAARSLSELSETLEQQPEAVIRGKNRR
jgi:paraquat-inducible protein B